MEGSFPALEMSGVLVWVNCGPKENINSLVSLAGRSSSGERNQRRFSGLGFSSGVSAFSGAVAAETARSSEERVYEVVLKQAALVKENRRGTNIALDMDKEVGTDFANGDLLNVAYDRCGEVCAEYAKTFYLGACYSFSLLSSLFSSSNEFWFSFCTKLLHYKLLMIVVDQWILEFYLLLVYFIV